MRPPVVSIVIPTYNRWPMVAQTVESALNQQTEEPFEVVVVDDGSTDGTAERLAESYPEARVFARPNRERGAARNFGASVSRGGFLSFVDSDDIVEPWHVAVMAAAVTGDDAPDRRAYAAPAWLWDPKTDSARLVAPPRRVRRHLVTAALLGNCLPLQGLLVPRARFEAVGGFPELREVAASEDWVFLARLVSVCPVRLLDRPTVRIREHAGRSTYDLEQMVPSRQAGCRLLLEEGIAGRALDDASRRLVIAGTHRFCAAHYYADGLMEPAREHLAKAVDAVGWRMGVPLVGRLWLQTHLGRHVGRGLRSLRQALQARVVRRRKA
jgi:hypothetical protein